MRCSVTTEFNIVFVVPASAGIETAKQAHFFEGLPREQWSTDSNPVLRSTIVRCLLRTGITGLSAGFEGGSWRSEQLAGHLIEWLPDLALQP